MSTKSVTPSADDEFGEFIRSLRMNKQTPLSELATRIGLDRSTIARWEMGAIKPRREAILKVSSALKLTFQETNSLLTSAHFAPLTHEEATSLGINTSEIFDVSQINFYTDSIRDFNTQIKDIQSSIDELNNRTRGTDISKPDAHTLTLNEEIQSLKKSFSELQITGQVLTAPVRIPTRETMEVSLVPSTLLARLEEYRGEESMWFSWFGIFVGAIIGVFVNVATGGQMQTEAWILIGVFMVMAGLTGWFAFQAQRRGNKLKEAILVKQQIL